MSRDTSFYYSFLVLPPSKRRAIIAVWDFCRAVDDAVDEAAARHEDVAGPAGVSADDGLSPALRARVTEELAIWRAELDACYAAAGGDAAATPRTSQARALVPCIREFSLPRRPFDELITGVEMDLGRVRYATFDDLSLYCWRVASTVGLICVEIFEYEDPAARDYAVNLGMALQLTNIIRDVAADLANGRLYLPQEDLDRFGVTEQDLRAGIVTPAVAALLRFECERARRYYEIAEARWPSRDARTLLAAEIMGAIYFEILRRIERAGYDVFSRRLRVPRPRRAVIALGIWARRLVSSARSRSRAVRPGGTAAEPGVDVPPTGVSGPDR